MARVTYGSIVTELKGSLGGTTFQKNKFGHTAKNKGIPKKQASAIQYVRRNAMLYIVQSWNNLTDNQRNLWNTYAITYPQPINSNVTVMLSGYALFIKYNAILLSVSIPLCTTPEIVPVTFPLLNPSLKYEVSTGKLFFNEGSTPFNIRIAIMFYLSAPIKQGQGFNKNKIRYVFKTLQGEGQIDIEYHYQNIFGLIPPVGSTIFAWCRMFDAYAPAISKPQSFILPVTAI